jgi:L-rhamnose mutarotase
MPRLYYALDLRDDPALIAEYERWHSPEAIWPEIIESIAAAGVRDMEIYRVDDRLVLTMDVDEDYSAEAKAAADNANPRVRAWEALMSTFQKPLPGSAPGEKWRPMVRIFSLAQSRNADDGGGTLPAEC